MLKRIAACASILGLLLALPACTIWGEHKPTAWTDITGGESLERVFWHEVQAKHWSDLETRLAPNFVLITPSGTYDRAAALEHWKQLDLTDYSLGEIESQLNGNTYTVTYVLNLRASVNGKAVPSRPLRAMTVWQRQVREQWLMIAHSATPASDTGK